MKLKGESSRNVGEQEEINIVNKSSDWVMDGKDVDMEIGKEQKEKRRWKKKDKGACKKGKSCCAVIRGQTKMSLQAEHEPAYNSGPRL